MWAEAKKVITDLESVSAEEIFNTIIAHSPSQVMTLIGKLIRDNQTIKFADLGKIIIDIGKGGIDHLTMESYETFLPRSKIIKKNDKYHLAHDMAHYKRKYQYKHNASDSKMRPVNFSAAVITDAQHKKMIEFKSSHPHVYPLFDSRIDDDSGEDMESIPYIDGEAREKGTEKFVCLRITHILNDGKQYNIYRKYRAETLQEDDGTESYTHHFELLIKNAYKQLYKDLL